MISFDNSYAALPADFYARQQPSPVSQPELIQVNEKLARQLNLDPQWLASKEGVAMLSGNAVSEGAEPIAMAYAGHQFGQWVPQLGDGRALLLGEVIGIDKQRYDIQLKGAGLTPFSRGGDGRNWVGPVLREYLVSEAMHALGVPTTRALAAVTTGDPVLREQGPLPGAILTRVARSHIRVGTFQYFTARQNEQAVERLVDYVIQRHYPHLSTADNKALALLQAVIDAQASLIAWWQSLGFIHGVMNTDNSSITGDTIDYGPCAFMDTYRADQVFSSIDRGARYAYQNQPKIAQWNLVNLAQCLLPLIGDDKEQAVSAAQTAIDNFDAHFVNYYLERMSCKLGLLKPSEDDLVLVQDLLRDMQEHKLDFTVTFRQLAYRKPTDPFAPGGPLNDWLLRWQRRVDEAAWSEQAVNHLLRSSNPAIIPRNHIIESLIVSAVENADFTPFYQMLDAVTHPFEQALDDSPYAMPPKPNEVVTQTFCGT